jgi:hypothetical protein
VRRRVAASAFNVITPGDLGYAGRALEHDPEKARPRTRSEGDFRFRKKIMLEPNIWTMIGLDLIGL